MLCLGSCSYIIFTIQGSVKLNLKNNLIRIVSDNLYRNFSFTIVEKKGSSTVLTSTSVKKLCFFYQVTYSQLN